MDRLQCADQSVLVRASETPCIITATYVFETARGGDSATGGCITRSCSAVRVTRSRAAIATVPRQPRHSSATHTAPRCAASRLVTMAGLTISVNDWENPEIEFA